jgi:4-amino-4-deoxychorismate lyase
MTEQRNEIFPFFESIRLYNGQYALTGLHEKRMKATREQHFGKTTDINLINYLHQFEFPKSGLFKCRIEYGLSLSKPEFIPYSQKVIETLRLIEDHSLAYSYKYTNRNPITNLLQQRQQCDDILIVQNGMITDTSYCNIIFELEGEWFTPHKPLFKGVQRQFLLDEGMIKSFPIKISDLHKFSHFRLVNAMIPWEESVCLPIGNIET